MPSKVTYDDSGWRRLVERLARAQELAVKVGVLVGKGGGDTAGGLSLVEIATVHEFGSPAANIPERSFIRRTFIDKRAELDEMRRKLVKRIVAGMEPEAALNMLGAWAAGAIRRTVTDGAGIPPPLRPATVERKGSSRPLVDTGRMLNAITWSVYPSSGGGIGTAAAASSLARGNG